MNAEFDFTYGCVSELDLRGWFVLSCWAGWSHWISRQMNRMHLFNAQMGSSPINERLVQTFACGAFNMDAMVQ
jgi:hypothetical protein